MTQSKNVSENGVGDLLDDFLKEFDLISLF